MQMVLCSESEENLSVMTTHFVEVCKRRNVKENADKSKVIVLGGNEGSVCGLLWMS